MRNYKESEKRCPESGVLSPVEVFTGASLPSATIASRVPMRKPYNDEDSYTERRLKRRRVMHICINVFMNNVQCSRRPCEHTVNCTNKCGGKSVSAAET